MQPHIPQHYPPNARYAALMARREHYRFTDLDGNGYLFKIATDNNSFISGAGPVCAYPINTATSHEIARDKTHCLRLLATHDIRTTRGDIFFVQSRFQKLQPTGHGIADAYAFADTLGYPIFCKPNRGSRGDFAQIIRDRGALGEYIAAVARFYDAIRIEQYDAGAEYRVLVYDGAAIYQIRKSDAQIIGDGRASIAALICALNKRTDGLGLSPYDTAALAQYHDAPAHILAKGQTLSLIGRRNLSATGDGGVVSLSVAPHFADLANKAAKAIGLRIAAVDFFYDTDGARIIEINSNPSFTALEQSGNLDIAIAIWAQMARELLRC